MNPVLVFFYSFTISFALGLAWIKFIDIARERARRRKEMKPKDLLNSLQKFGADRAKKMLVGVAANAAMENSERAPEHRTLRTVDDLEQYRRELQNREVEVWRVREEIVRTQAQEQERAAQYASTDIRRLSNDVADWHRYGGAVRVTGAELAQTYRSAGHQLGDIAAAPPTGPTNDPLVEQRLRGNW